MKRQPRPFVLEIKNARNRAVTPSSFCPQSDRLSSRQGDLWKQTLQENVATTKRASFSREAEAMFDKANNPAPQREASTPVARAEHQPRVLPDLRQVASADAPALTLNRRPRKPLKPKQLRKQAEQHAKVPQRQQVAVAQVEPLTPPVAPLQVIRRKPRWGMDTLPKWERWKQRRLPRCCWT